jgi:DNA-directed RNA polymerase subunit K/omega
MDTNDTEDVTGQEPEAPAGPRPRSAPISNRFLFVDIAAMRAKQLRRGALPRLDDEPGEAPRVLPHKAERVAMEEVKHCLVLYDVPPLPGAPPR